MRKTAAAAEAAAQERAVSLSREQVSTRFGRRALNAKFGVSIGEGFAGHAGFRGDWEEEGWRAALPMNLSAA